MKDEPRLSWPMCFAIINHYRLVGISIHISGGGESKIQGSVD